MTNSLVAKMSPTITSVIRKDHTKVNLLYHQYRGAGISAVRKKTLVDTISALLMVHAIAEEETFYPAMRSFQDDQERIDTHQKEHELMKQSIEKLQSADPSTTEFDELLHGLMKQVLHHVAEEESMLLPQAEKRLSAQALHELGARMIQRKMELMSEYMKPVQRVGSFVKGNPVKSAIFGAAVIAAGVSYFQRGRRRSSFLNRL